MSPTAWKVAGRPTACRVKCVTTDAPLVGQGRYDPRQDKMYVPHRRDVEQ